MNNSEKISNRRKADSMIFPIDCWTWKFFSSNRPWILKKEPIQEQFVPWSLCHKNWLFLLK